jgi:O-antigen/teichoic acid export membrane protein
MVATMLSLEHTGTYGILLFMANTIEIPSKSMYQIGGPVISSSIAHGEMKNVENVYKKSSINSLLVGILLFSILWAVLYNIFDLMPNNEDFYIYKNVFLFLCLGKLVDMTFSLNTHIIVYSKYYKYNLVFVLVLAVANLVLNYFFIREFGLTGAAMATALSMILYNITKLFFIKYRFKLWPFSINTLKVIVIAMITIAISTFLPDLFLSWPDILIKGAIIFLAYYFLLKVFSVKAEIINVFENKAENVLDLMLNRKK